LEHRQMALPNLHSTRNHSIHILAPKTDTTQSTTSRE
jgi:hypothetical protein